MKKITDFVNEGRSVEITDYNSLMYNLTEALCGNREAYENLMSYVDFFVIGSGNNEYGNTITYRAVEHNGYKILFEVSVNKH